MSEMLFQNPHLEGDAFFWEGGLTGALLIHGFTATTAEIRPLARALYGRGYTVAGPLLPGHKASPADVNRYRWQDWVQVVAEAYERLAGQCDRVFVGGESAGAVLSLHLASKHPEIAGLLLYAPALRLMLRPIDALVLTLIAMFVPYVPKPRRGTGTTTHADALWQGYMVNPLKGGRELLRLQRVVRGRLPGVRQPVFIAQGKLDPTVDPRAPQMILDGVRSSVKEMHWFDRSAHCVLLDDEWEDVTALTLRFLDRVISERLSE